MVRRHEPVVGAWFRTSDGASFEVVASDPDDATVEIQYSDGAIEELDMETWLELDLESGAPLNDVLDSLDVDDDEGGMNGNPLDRLDLDR